MLVTVPDQCLYLFYWYFAILVKPKTVIDTKLKFDLTIRINHKRGLVIGRPFTNVLLIERHYEYLIPVLGSAIVYFVFSSI